MRGILEQQLREGVGVGAGDDAPTEVSEPMVTREAVRLSEAEACGGKVAVMTLGALYQAESDLAVALELQAAGVDGDGYVPSQRRLAASTARRDEMRRRRDTLRAAREAAVETLRSALLSGNVGRVTEQLLVAREAALEGSFEQDGLGPGGHWAICEVRDAYVQLAEARKAEAEAAMRAARAAELSKLRARTELLGLDRWGRRYWQIDGAEPASAGGEAAGGSSGGADGADSSDGADGRTDAAAAQLQLALWVQPACGGVAGVLGGLPPDVTAQEAAGWQRLESTAACQQLAGSLDHRGRRERALKHNLSDHPELVAARRSASAAQTGSLHAAAADLDAGGEAEPQEGKPEPMEE